MRFKSKKIEKTLITVKQENSIRHTTALYEINRRIIFNRIVKKYASAADDQKNRMLLTFVGKNSIFSLCKSIRRIRIFF